MCKPFFLRSAYIFHQKPPAVEAAAASDEVYGVDIHSGLFCVNGAKIDFYAHEECSRLINYLPPNVFHSHTRVALDLRARESEKENSITPKSRSTTRVDLILLLRNFGS